MSLCLLDYGIRWDNHLLSVICYPGLINLFRKFQEQKGGKSYQKIGFVDVNLSQFAASGVEGITQSYLLDGYGNNQRQDNSRLLIKVTMSHQSADPIFKVFVLFIIDSSSIVKYRHVSTYLVLSN